MINNVAKTTYAANSLATGAAHTFWVRAVSNDHTQSSWSAAQSFQTTGTAITSQRPVVANPGTIQNTTTARLVSDITIHEGQSATATVATNGAITDPIRVEYVVERISAESGDLSISSGVVQLIPGDGSNGEGLGVIAIFGLEDLDEDNETFRIRLTRVVSGSTNVKFDEVSRAKWAGVKSILPALNQSHGYVSRSAFRFFRAEVNDFQQGSRELQTYVIDMTPHIRFFYFQKRFPSQQNVEDELSIVIDQVDCPHALVWVATLSHPPRLHHSWGSEQLAYGR